jgi:hypothetical protein
MTPGKPWLAAIRLPRTLRLRSKPGLVSKHEWRPVVGKAAKDTPNIQWGGVGRESALNP